MNTCTTCQHQLLTEAFFRKGKLLKTCFICLTKKSEKAVKQVPSVDNKLENQFENKMEEIIFTDIIEYISNKIANLEQDARLFFNLCVKLNDDTLITAHHDMKLLITTGPTISVYHSGIAKEISVKLCHNIQHEKPIDLTTPPEIKYEIMENLYMDPVQLQTHLCQTFDISQITPKQINYLWSTFCQRFSN
ncbi:12486_t:CDS:2 [Ambispora gerdemannii]|uniref:12486_t:CDS:1 n=1 Tax=Ambispora gerdemannii TaxID=144530 RepID=A0A9N9H741_9GLOM|nr:12486_t:CDS:2 [Ambispora gerdemannii]